MSTNGLPDVTGAPSIIIGGATYTLRWSQLAQFELSDAGYSPSEMFKAMAREKGDDRPPDPKALAYTYRIFAAMLAHNFTDRGLAVPDARHWAGVMPTEKVVEMYTAITGALKNAAPLAQPAKNQAEQSTQPS